MTRDSTWYERGGGDIFGVFLVVGGLVTLGGIWLRPWWFWEHPKALFHRRILGDSGTALFYMIIGMGMVYLGFFTTFRITH